jgi:hypothetical protein
MFFEQLDDQNTSPRILFCSKKTADSQTLDFEHMRAPDRCYFKMLLSKRMFLQVRAVLYALIGQPITLHDKHVELATAAPRMRLSRFDIFILVKLPVSR